MAFAIADEIQTSRWQAKVISLVARKLAFHVESGPSEAIRFPTTGPYNERLGYTRVPAFIELLEPQGYSITAQARMSPWLLTVTDGGFFTPYREKNQAGLELRGCRGESLQAARFPERGYARFENIPRLLVDSVLFIEDHGLLDESPTRNPAVEWDRFAAAMADQALHLLDGNRPTPGASTLATQIEKYRHSRDGRTESGREKLRQMTSASLRAYLDGPDTRKRRQQIVLDYINTVPLAAQVGFGEVNGLGDGLWAWYGRDLADINPLLVNVREDAPVSSTRLEAQATAFKQALSLMIAERRPAYYLPGAETNLGEVTNRYLRLMTEAHIIPATLRDAALPVQLRLLTRAPQSPTASFVDRKVATAVRTRLSSLLDVSRNYDLNRLDLVAGTTVDGETQRAATRTLRGLRDPAAAKKAGLYGYHLLEHGDDPSKLMFSFTLFERGERANLLRVQTDNFDQPFDINEGARLDLGSTAKLRTLVLYLQVVADLHARWSSLETRELAAVGIDKRDQIGHWARDYLSQAKDKSLARMLEAAMLRTYSASPYEAFFTGGGLHRFENFEPEDNTRILTVREGFRRSVNLVFVRLMRDVVNHVIAQRPDSDAWPLEKRLAASGQTHLARFADREGRQYLTRFYRKYQGMTPLQAEETLLEGIRATPTRLASAFGVFEPGAGVGNLGEFLERHLPPEAFSAQAVGALHAKYSVSRASFVDRAAMIGVHPLELWLVGYLREHPSASLATVIAASNMQRQEAYGWLFTSRNKNAQDDRIRSQLELEAFVEIQRAWRKLGYPFDSLTPSYATALGSSGDRPAALAELMGIIVNRGVRMPVSRLESLVFARATPYETRLDYQPPNPERVLPIEIADVVRRSLVDVVAGGTAVRLRNALARFDGAAIEFGGKTGTGDHRFEVHGRGGQVISSRVVSRSATFVFLIGDRYFGTVMVYAPEPYAAKYKFTSALPVQLLKSMAPAMLPLLEGDGCMPTDASSG
jgi:membrane peptidoglycan carboxypeptidase